MTQYQVILLPSLSKMLSSKSFLSLLVVSVTVMRAVHATSEVSSAKQAFGSVPDWQAPARGRSDAGVDAAAGIKADRGAGAGTKSPCKQNARATTTYEHVSLSAGTSGSSPDGVAIAEAEVTTSDGQSKKVSVSIVDRRHLRRV